MNLRKLNELEKPGTIRSTFRMRAPAALRESFALDHLANGRNNNFDLLRFIAATLVILSHCYALGYGASRPEPVWTYFGGFETGGSLGVLMFFVISGFLVTQSFLNRRGELFNFVTARLLRIYPALFVAVLVSCLLAGFTSSLPWRTFLSHPDTVRFLLHNSLAYRIEFALPGVFSHNPTPGGVNGSLWTLPLELEMYCICASLGVLGLFSSRVVFNGLFVCAILVAYVVKPEALPLVAAHPEALRLTFAFLLGMFFCLNRRHIRLSLPWGALLVIAIFFLHRTANFRLLYVPAAAYLVLLLAYHPRLHWPSFHRIGDYSYGLYIYAFPIQQTIAFYQVGIPPLALFLFAYPVILVAAVLSWHLIEKPALKMKPRRQDVSPQALV